MQPSLPDGLSLAVSGPTKNCGSEKETLAGQGLVQRLCSASVNAKARTPKNFSS